MAGVVVGGGGGGGGGADAPPRMFKACPSPAEGMGQGGRGAGGGDCPTAASPNNQIRAYTDLTFMG